MNIGCASGYECFLVLSFFTVDDPFQVVTATLPQHGDDVSNWVRCLYGCTALRDSQPYAYWNAVRFNVTNSSPVHQCTRRRNK